MALFQRILTLSLFLLTPITLQAAPYFPADTIPPTIIAAPPAPQSAEWKKNVAHIIAIQQHPSSKDLKQANEEREMRPELLLDKAISRQSYPAIYALLDRVGETSLDVTDATKKYWNTRRPYLMDKRVKALIDAHDNPSYPSGHTTGSYLWAQVLALVWPEKRDMFMARAESIAQHRVLVGMHYPHDLEGGKALASILMGGLLQNAEFQKDLQQAKLEIQKTPQR